MLWPTSNGNIRLNIVVPGCPNLLCHSLVLAGNITEKVEPVGCLNLVTGCIRDGPIVPLMFAMPLFGFISAGLVGPLMFIAYRLVAPAYAVASFL
jgi:hypothetical protein